MSQKLNTIEWMLEHFEEHLEVRRCDLLQEAEWAGYKPSTVATYIGNRRLNGWFVRVKERDWRGMYRLSPKGWRELIDRRNRRNARD